MQVEAAEAEEFQLARRTLIEGQATVVQVDYILHEKQAGDPEHRDFSLTGSEQSRQSITSFIRASYSPMIAVHDVPRVLRDILHFPYVQGLDFVIALLDHGGRAAAFPGAFQRPPRNTHEILQPAAYFARQPLPDFVIPDLSSALSPAWEAYDSGGLGEFDMQVMAQEYGIENDIYTVARQWDGAGYVAVRHAGHAKERPAAADLGLVFVSRWKTHQAAERMGGLYLQALAKRLPIQMEAVRRCEKDPCTGPLWQQRASSAEGLISVELYPGNLLLISHGIEAERLPALRALVRAPFTGSAVGALPNDAPSLSAKAGAAAMQVGANAPELLPRLLEMPALQPMAAEMEEEWQHRLADTVPYLLAQ